MKTKSLEMDARVGKGWATDGKKGNWRGERQRRKLEAKGNNAVERTRSPGRPHARILSCDERDVQLRMSIARYVGVNNRRII